MAYDIILPAAIVKTIETTILVRADHTATLRVPDDVSPGEHRAVIVVEQNGDAIAPRQPLVLPVDDVGPWPKDYVVRREDFYDDQV